MEVEAIAAGRRYGKTWALRGLSCRNEPGTVGAIVGPNGAGKTTWLRLLAGVLFPTEGEVRFDGRPFDRRDTAFRRRLFFLPDILPVAGGQSPLGHAAMVLGLYGRDAASATDALMDLYARLDLLDRLETPLAKLSRGQFYKSVLAPLMLLRPELWLIDEPFASGMDPEGMMVFREEARAAAAGGCTVLFTTQILEVAEDCADVIHVIHDGRLAVSASPTDLAATSGQGTASAGLLQLLRRLRGGAPA